MTNKFVKNKKKGGRPSRKPDNMELILRMYEEHTSKELGELYGVPAGTVRAWVYQARKECVQNEQ